MAGHNKWSKVKHIKARVDAIKGRVFSKCAHEIALATHAGGGDPAANARLRTATDRAIKKGTGELGGEAIQEISYEGFGPAGIAFIIEMATDNPNRVAADTRLILTKNGGVATPGSVSYQFDRKGEIHVHASELSQKDVFEAAIEGDDVPRDSEKHLILTTANEPGTIANPLRRNERNIISEKLVPAPQTLAVVSEPTIARQVVKLHDQLDDYADTLNVFTNFEVADEILDQLAS